MGCSLYLLANPPRDLVGMARTGSGKTLGYMIPLVQRLGGRHSTTFGARALILIPTRELALQILRVGKELARGWHSSQGDHAGDSKTEETSKGQSLRWGLVVGGEGMDEQFEMMTNNPDVYVHSSSKNLDRRSCNLQHHRYPWTSLASHRRNESGPQIRPVRRLR